MVGIANKNYVKDLTQIHIFIFKLENIKVCYWAMSKICKAGGGVIKNMFPYF